MSKVPKIKPKKVRKRWNLDEASRALGLHPIIIEALVLSNLMPFEIIDNKYYFPIDRTNLWMITSKEYKILKH